MTFLQKFVNMSTKDVQYAGVSAFAVAVACGFWSLFDASYSFGNSKTQAVVKAFSFNVLVVACVLFGVYQIMMRQGQSHTNSIATAFVVAAASAVAIQQTKPSWAISKSKDTINIPFVTFLSVAVGFLVLGLVEMFKQS